MQGRHVLLQVKKIFRIFELNFNFRLTKINSTPPIFGPKFFKYFGPLIRFQRTQILKLSNPQVQL
jgi:hypothetical protein